MLLGLRLRQKPLQTCSRWFEYSEKIRCRSKTNSANKINWKIKKLDNYSNATGTGDDKSMFMLIILEKIKQTRLKVSQGHEIV